MFNKNISLFLAISLSVISHGMAQLQAGSIMFVGFNADGNDGFSVVAVDDIPANSTIYFSDNEWNGSPVSSGGAFNDTNEGIIIWDTGGSIISQGTVINFLSVKNSSKSVSVGSITSGTTSLAQQNEVLYAYIGSSSTTPSTFLTAISNDGFSHGIIAGTGLSEGINATAISGDEDVMVYTGSTACNDTWAACLADLSNSSNWSTEDTGSDDSNNGGIDFPSSVPSSFSGSALPVELIAFNGEYDDDTASLHWITVSEINNKGFEIQKSLDGHLFLPIGFVTGFGNSTTKLTYQFSDPYFTQTSYYRLKQIDFDGQSELSKIILLERGLSSLGIYPNPIYDQVQISVEEPFFEFSIFDHKGRQIKNAELSRKQAENSILSLASGIYMVKIGAAETQSVFRIVKR